MSRSLLCTLSIFICFQVTAQQAEVHSTYDPHALFAPLTMPSSRENTRTATGEPGQQYWQNRADYEMQVSLNDITNEISGSVIITYKNNSPMALPYLWLQLDQNLFNKNSRDVLKTLKERVNGQTQRMRTEMGGLKEAMEQKRQEEK